MEKLASKVVEYAWGSRTTLADLLGRPTPSARPEAELWLGAHPVAPSTLPESGDQELGDRIASAPEDTLGPEVASAFGARLPFLLKVLAVESPLSMQAHPTSDQARAGFAREEAAGIPVTAPTRSYRDPSHKPEVVFALGPFAALSGFRPAALTLELLDALGSRSLAPVSEALRRSPGPEGLRAAFEMLMTWPRELRPALLDDVVTCCREAATRLAPWRAELAWAVELARLYPGDVGAASSLLLNLVNLEAGQALYLPAGNLHCYLGGVAVELMANSDNVLRGGLTSKHVDVPELLRVLAFDDRRPRLLAGAEAREVQPPVPDFRLSMRRVAAGRAAALPAGGPAIALVLEGRARLEGGGRALELDRGASAWMPASDGPCALEGDALVAVASAGMPPAAGRPGR